MQLPTLRHTLTLSIFMFMPSFIAAASSSNEPTSNALVTSSIKQSPVPSLQQLAIEALVYTKGVRRYMPQELALDTAATKKKLQKRINRSIAELTQQKFYVIVPTEEGDRTFPLELHDTAAYGGYIDRGMENFVRTWKDAVRVLSHTWNYFSDDSDLFKLSRQLSPFDKIFSVCARGKPSQYGQSAGLCRVATLDKNDTAILNALPIEKLQAIIPIVVTLRSQYETIMRACAFAQKIHPDSDAKYWNQLASKAHDCITTGKNLKEAHSILVWFDRHNIASMIKTISPEDDRRRCDAWATLYATKINELKKSLESIQS